VVEQEMVELHNLEDQEEVQQENQKVVHFLLVQVIHLQ
jgi:hypothetical protein